MPLKLIEMVDFLLGFFFFLNHDFLKATLTALLPQKEKHTSSKKWNAFRQRKQAESKG